MVVLAVVPSVLLALSPPSRSRRKNDRWRAPEPLAHTSTHTWCQSIEWKLYVPLRAAGSAAASAVTALTLLTASGPLGTTHWPCRVREWAAAAGCAKDNLLTLLTHVLEPRPADARVNENDSVSRWERLEQQVGERLGKCDVGCEASGSVQQPTC